LPLETEKTVKFIYQRDIKAHFGNFLYLMKTCNWFNK
jgi:hypothetical protein